MPEDLANYRRIAFLFAVADEVRPFASRLAARKSITLGDRRGISGMLGSREVLLVAGGMGARCAESAAHALVSEWLPGALIIAGVAGALSSDLQRGDLLSATAVRTEDTVWKPSVGVPGVAEGDFLSIDRVLVTAAEKSAALNTLGPMNGSVAVEMETAAAARVAEHHRIPWGAIRAISDSARDELPLDFNLLRDKNGDLSVSTVAMVAMRRPAHIPGLLRLGSATNLAARALSDALYRSLAE